MRIVGGVIGNGGSTSNIEHPTTNIQCGKNSRSQQSVIQ
jgi:hypothetical protein